MKWHEFLNDHELNADKKYHNRPDGGYLFGKVSHDVLECLTAYRGYLEILATLKNNDIAPVTFQWLSKWNIIAEEWIVQITSLVDKHREKYSARSEEWAKLINDIGHIITETPTFKAEIEPLELPNNGQARQVIELAIMQSKKLELIRRDIETQEYKRLWTIVRYSDLVETN